MRRQSTRRRLSMGRSLIVWVVGAVVGWVVAFIAVYYSIRTGDTVIADFFGIHSSQHETQQVAEPAPAEPRIPQDEIDALKKIAPAAGGEQSSPGSNGQTTGD